MSDNIALDQDNKDDEDAYVKLVLLGEDSDEVIADVDLSFSEYELIKNTADEEGKTFEEKVLEIITNFIDKNSGNKSE